MSDWLSVLKKAKKSCLVNGKLKKVHYEFDDGREMAEEWNMELKIAIRRAWRQKNELGGDDKWFIELGDADPEFNKGDILIKENASQPFIERRVTKINLEWRIRNLLYSADNYSVIINEDKNKIIVKTANKKYYKVLDVPELYRLNIKLDNNSLSFVYNNFNTLVITYKKPQQLIEFEKLLFEEVNKLKPKNYHPENVNECKQS